MRISDWSSDVCSSDLPRADRAQDVGSSPTTKPREEQMRTFGLFTVAAMGLCIATANSAAAQEHVFKLHHLLGAKAPAQTQMLEPWARQVEENAAGRVKIEKIGRASCRDRVGQYV